VHVVWTNNCELAMQADAAKGLIDSGVDVLAADLDNPITVVQTAEKSGVYSIGCHADLQKFAPKRWLTGATWDWGPLYVKIAKSIEDRSWMSGNYRYAMRDGYVKLSSFGTSVPKNVQAEALAVRRHIEDGTFVVFSGPLKDRNGKQLLPAGEKPSVDFIESMNWLVPGVEGTLPIKK